MGGADQVGDDFFDDEVAVDAHAQPAEGGDAFDGAVGLGVAVV